MPSLFPTSLPLVGSASSTDTLAAAGHTALHNNGADETRAIATKLGTGSSTPASGQVLRGTGVGTSSWGALDMSTDITGVLGQGNGGTGTTDANGTGAALYEDSPFIFTPTISGATISTPTITNPTVANPVMSNPIMSGGGSWSGAPTITDLSGMQHDHASAVGGGPIDTTLGYAEITTSFAAGTGAETDITGVTVAVTVPTGGHRIQITFCGNVYNSSAGTGAKTVRIKEGATTLATGKVTSALDTVAMMYFSAVFTATSGAHTYKASIASSTGNGNVEAGAGEPAFILVEII